MAQRMYESQAAKQRAYRARQKQLAATRAAEGLSARFPATPAPAFQYHAWRRAIAEASSILERTAEEVNEWMQERSERWQESDRASELQADYERVQEALEALSNLEALSPVHV